MIKSKIVKNIFLDFIIFFVAAPILILLGMHAIEVVNNELLEKVFYMTMAIFFFGIFLNRLVIYSNGLKMPVKLKDCGKYAFNLGKNHCPVSRETKLNFLGDIIPIGTGCYVSVGDILIFLSSILVFVMALTVGILVNI